MKFVCKWLYPSNGNELFSYLPINYSHMKRMFCFIDLCSTAHTHIHTHKLFLLWLIILSKSHNWSFFFRLDFCLRFFSLCAIFQQTGKRTSGMIKRKKPKPQTNQDKKQQQQLVKWLWNRNDAQQQQQKSTQFVCTHLTCDIFEHYS